MLVAITVAVACHTAVRAPVTTPILRFATDKSWLNLHHFLHVLGRAKNGEPDARGLAVAGAAKEEARGLASLSDVEQQVWMEAVTSYATGLARRDLIFADTLVVITEALGRAGDRPTLDGVSISPSLRVTLERAMAIYRKAWWPQHREWNESWVREANANLDTLGRPMLDFLVRVYALPWSADGYPVHLSGFSNWAGAYSVTGKFIIMGTNDANPRGPVGLEAAFHEAMHQWDDSMLARIQDHARRQNRPPPRDLSHALIFYTTGDAMKRLIANYSTYADLAGIWNRALGRFLPALRQEWQPYLDRKVALDVALERLVAAAPR